MRTGFVIRHQHQGIVSAHVFESTPTDEQIVAVLSEIARRHAGPFYQYDPIEHAARVEEGTATPQHEGSWWKIEQVTIYGSTEVPSIPPDPNAREGMAAPQVLAFGSVTGG